MQTLHVTFIQSSNLLALLETKLKIGLLKRGFLALAGIRPFASDAIFRNPCATLKLSNVACKMCDTLRELGCDGEYDRVAMEIELVWVVGVIERSDKAQVKVCGTRRLTKKALEIHGHSDAIFGRNQIRDGRGGQADVRLEHEAALRTLEVAAVLFSRFATASVKSIRILDSDNG